MTGGILNKLSESVVASSTSIQVKTELVRLTGSTAIATILPPQQGGFSGMIVLVPVDGTIATTTAGNITIVVTMPQNRATILVYSKGANVWYPGAIS